MSNPTSSDQDSDSFIRTGFSATPGAVKLLRNWPDRAESLALDLGHYVDFLLAENRKFNLTGDTEPQRQWQAHIEDALMAAVEVEKFLKSVDEFPPSMRIVDVGSGAGVPGLVWAKLWPSAEVCLVESVEKKGRFLEQAAKVIEAENVKVVKGRAEDLARLSDHRESYDLAVARGVAKFRVLAEWTLPFVRPGGSLIAIKGDEIEEELAVARTAFETLGGESEPHRLPYLRNDGKRCQAVVCRKIGPTPGDYPRRSGMARKRPL